MTSCCSGRWWPGRQIPLRADRFGERAGLLDARPVSAHPRLARAVGPVRGVEQGGLEWEIAWPARLKLKMASRRSAPPSRLVDTLWIALVIASTGYAAWRFHRYLSATLGLADLLAAVGYGLITLARVVVLIALATLIWVPVGVWIGLRPKLAERIQPLAQFLAAFPANLAFPVFVVVYCRATASIPISG